MINPSISGWIDKFFLEQNSTNQIVLKDAESFYEETRKTGFLIGHTTSFVTANKIETTGWTAEELSKVGLLNCLYSIYQLQTQNLNSDSFLQECVNFYNNLHPKGIGLFNKILPQDSNANQLEKIIGTRIQTTNNLLNKNFSHIITNVLLFTDVLAFQKFLILKEVPKDYLKKVEEAIIKIVSLSLEIKNDKTKYDNLLLSLFESSLRYTKYNKQESVALDAIDYTYFNDDFEKFYFIDIACMTIWSDGTMNTLEQDFLYSLAEKLKISKSFTTKSISDVNDFFEKNRNEIPYLNFSSPAKHFYDQTTQHVQKLISRNKTRLLLEISQSKELVNLLAQSTKRDLNVDEKKKVRTQILDICKTIPSLTIFIIPGGSFLLPILIKFIPQLLPSAFNENLIDK